MHCLEEKQYLLKLSLAADIATFLKLLKGYTPIYYIYICVCISRYFQKCRPILTNQRISIIPNPAKIKS